MLRKIEGELTYMCEKREYLAAKPKGTLMGNGQPLDLHALEAKVDRDRKETKRNLKLEKDRAIQREKEEKNEAKKLKQQNLVIFKRVRVSLFMNVPQKGLILCLCGPYVPGTVHT